MITGPEKFHSILNSFVDAYYGFIFLGVAVIAILFLGITTYRNFRAFQQTYEDNRKQGIDS